MVKKNVGAFTFMKTEFRTSCDNSFKAHELESRVRKYLCYGWRRNGDYLYIGKSTRGYERLFKHKVVGKIEPIQERDEFDFWFCDASELDAYEKFLINLFKPKHNDQMVRRKMSHNERAKERLSWYKV